ncbi:DUF4190 domain-containing protein [Pengzhenrongella phosphoraccumulans]|jgi:hypothetical protein|uniref:DUF4190 domain-containing protein n=1 Tax=Pengzhenrongella phosphoraccumulans TaxID=3114394 RepID=UPI00388E8FA4
MTDQLQSDPFFGFQLPPVNVTATVPSVSTAETAGTAEPIEPVRRSRALAIISLVAGLCGFSLVPLLGSIVAVITGHLALAQIGETDVDASNLARAGLWLGYLAMALIVLAGAAFMLVVVVRSSAL